MRVLLESVKKTYRNPDGSQHVVLDGVNLEIHTGEFVVVMGPSGCGKTTLLFTVGGLLSCDSGVTSLGSVVLGPAGRKDGDRFRNQNVGFIFQGPQLIQSLDLVDNVLLPTFMRGRPIDKTAARARAIHLLDRLGLSDRLTCRPHQLNTGQAKRVAIARALINNPRLILSDEPTSDLDTPRAVQIVRVLKDLSREGRSVIVATHDSRVADAADRCFVLEDGRLSDHVSNWIER